MSVDLSVVIPAHNEVGYVEACLDALVCSDPTGGAVEVIVAANGCTDATVAVAEAFAERFTARGWGYRVLDLPQGGKMGAMNAADEVAQHAARVYLDADVNVSPPVLAQLAQALDVPQARYASGKPNVTVDGRGFSAVYTRFWVGIPFLTSGVPGFGLFAVNAAGRARWGAFPDIISDDTFVRLSFTPEERVSVPAPYDWPMIEGFWPLVRVRRRQDIGVPEVKSLYPALWQNHDPVSPAQVPLWRRALRDPKGFAAFVAVALAVRLPAPGAERWARGR